MTNEDKSILTQATAQFRHIIQIVSQKKSMSQDDIRLSGVCQLAHDMCIDTLAGEVKDTTLIVADIVVYSAKRSVAGIVLQEDRMPVSEYMVNLSFACVLLRVAELAKKYAVTKKEVE